METNQQILGAITNIKVPGIATMSYWSILKTKDAIYFIQSGTAIGLGVGTNMFLMLASVAGDVLESHKAKETANRDLASVLAEAKQYFSFTKEQYGLLKIKQGIFGGGNVEFPNGKEKSWRESGCVDFSLSRKQFKVFIGMLNS